MSCRTTSENRFNRVEFAKPAQNLEPDATHLRLDVGKRAILMLCHDVSFGSECCKARDDLQILWQLWRMQCDALVKSQQERVDAAMIRQ